MNRNNIKMYSIIISENHIRILIRIISLHIIRIIISILRTTIILKSFLKNIFSNKYNIINPFFLMFENITHLSNKFLIL